MRSYWVIHCFETTHNIMYLMKIIGWIIILVSVGDTTLYTTHVSKRFTGLYTGPYFDTNTSTNVTTQLGTHAYLPCKVKQLGNKSVSWIRRRDAHILTVDRYTFIADGRFQAFLVEGSDTWTLQVKYVQERDAGEYECQVSTEPKMSHFITLNVVVPKIEILGESDIYVKTGSPVTIKCVITQSLEEPAYIFWYHDNERVLNYDPSALDIRVERTGPGTTVGTLVINSVRTEDSGNYSCNPSNLDSASVLLHVLNGEHPAAMQRGKNSASPIPGRWWSHFSAGLGLAACTPPRVVVSSMIMIAFIGQILTVRQLIIS
ncbi:zwei Ig domain protein zig-8-like isoform X2 [Chrysoperla carnea]|uniref:zwei Ig domain protein zig-8-like isoform X2 n=2 Tax=Chrysoperla carnea TaxID=189513 RepID=UPI001D07AB7E|nr:zwei Ig domain protein zig-8-like isoform X2 [Chrysoperla carnea]XP_044735846.1 zwei Ig domain protein zig-8-like isoform X2 [Chrysoperla carnea]